MNSKILIRKFERRDISHCVVIVARTLGWDDAMIALEHFKDYFNNSEFEHLFVAENNGSVIGVCGTFCCSEYPKGLCGLHWFAVEPDFQRKGIGTRLLKLSLQIARESYGTIFVQSFDDACGFYLKHGFKPSPDLIRDPMKETRFLIKALR